MFEKIKNYRDQKQSSGGILKKYLKKIWKLKDYLKRK